MLRGVRADSREWKSDSKWSCSKWHASRRIVCKVNQTMSNPCRRPGDADFVSIGFDSSEP